MVISYYFITMQFFTPSITVDHDFDSKQTLLSCINPINGGIDINKFLAYSQSLSDEAQQRSFAIIAQGYSSSGSRFRDEYDNTEDGETVQSPQKKTRCPKCMARCNNEGESEAIKPTESFFGICIMFKILFSKTLVS
jgi:hypothetical protein